VVKSQNRAMVQTVIGIVP